jgi:hypothetical protein
VLLGPNPLTLSSWASVAVLMSTAHTLKEHTNPDKKIQNSRMGSPSKKVD